MKFKEKIINIDFYDFDDSLIKIVEQYYNIGEFIAVQPIILDGEYASLLEVRSETSKKMIFTTTFGKYFLKQIPWYCDSDDDLQFSINNQLNLYNKNIPMAKIIQNNEGNYYINVNNKKFVVFEYINGRRFTGKIEEIKSAALSLAKINSELPIGNDRTDYFKIIEDQIEIIDFGEYSDFKTYLLKFINNINNNFSINWFYNLEPITLHGDFNKWNLVFDPSNSEVLGVLDFDNIDCGPRIRDLSEAILSFGVICYKKDSTNFTEKVYSKENFVYAKEFYKAYNFHADLSDLERFLLPDLIKVVFLELVTLGLIRKDFSLNQLLINNIKLFIQDEINVLVKELYN